MANLKKYFGLRVDVVRELDPKNYSEFMDTFRQWLDKNPSVKEQAPELYIHRINFDIEPTKFKVAGIDNRVSSLKISVAINRTQREKGLIKFINHQIGHRLWPAVEHHFGLYENWYELKGTQLVEVTHFEEYLATVVLKGLSEADRKVKFAVRAYATPAYGSQTLKNVALPVVTKFDFWLTRDVQLLLQFDIQSGKG